MQTRRGRDPLAARRGALRPRRNRRCQPTPNLRTSRFKALRPSAIASRRRSISSQKSAPCRSACSIATWISAVALALAERRLNCARRASCCALSPAPIANSPTRKSSTTERARSSRRSRSAIAAINDVRELPDRGHRGNQWSCLIPQVNRPRGASIEEFNLGPFEKYLSSAALIRLSESQPVKVAGHLQIALVSKCPPRHRSGRGHLGAGGIVCEQRHCSSRVAEGRRCVAS